MKATAKSAAALSLNPPPGSTRNTWGAHVWGACGLMEKEEEEDRDDGRIWERRGGW